MWGFESSIPSHTARSSSGPGHRPLKAEIAGSNPARATKLSEPGHCAGLFVFLSTEDTAGTDGSGGDPRGWRAACAVVDCAGGLLRRLWRRALLAQGNPPVLHLPCVAARACTLPAMTAGSITDVRGIRVGHWTDP